MVPSWPGDGGRSEEYGGSEAPSDDTRAPRMAPMNTATSGPECVECWFRDV